LDGGTVGSNCRVVKRFHVTIQVPAGDGTTAWRRPASTRRATPGETPWWPAWPQHNGGGDDLAEDGGECPFVAGFDGPSPETLHIGHSFDALLVMGPKVQVVLKELAQQLTALGLEVVFELGVRQRGGSFARQEVHHQHHRR